MLTHKVSQSWFFLPPFAAFLALFAVRTAIDES
jgi:hypothetical protein